MTAVFRNDDGVCDVVAEWPLSGVWPLRLIERKWGWGKSLEPTELSSVQGAGGWIASCPRRVCPNALGGVDRPRSGPA